MLGYFRRSRYFALLGKNINDGCSRFRRSSGLFYSLPRYCGVAALSLPIGLSNGRSAHSESICSDHPLQPHTSQERQKSDSNELQTQPAVSAHTDSEDKLPIQLMSDLHLEFFMASTPDGGTVHSNGYEVFDIEPAAPTLALLGDIGETVDPGLFIFLEKQLTKFERVLFVMGNHEGYRSTYKKSKADFRKFAANVNKRPGLGKFYFLDRVRLNLSPEVTVLACTLWSHVLEDPANTGNFTQVGDWSIARHNRAHERDVKWLANQIAQLERKEPNRRVVIFSHYAPACDGTSDSKRKGNPRLETEMSQILREEKTWAYGHTHNNCDFEKDGVRFITNQRGYDHRKPRGNEFRDKFVLRV